MPDINAAPIYRFEDGGTLVIRDQGGATDLVVLNIIEGTLRVRPPGRASLPHDTDRGVLLTSRRRGNQQAGSISLDVKWTGGISATELYGLLTAEGDGSDQHLPPYEFEITWYEDGDQTTGVQLLCEHCTRDELPEIAAGAEYDTMTVRMATLAVTPSAVTPA